MELDTAKTTTSAALAARDRLGAASRLAETNERMMAPVARAAVFEEALLAALRARFNELRSVAK
jgi:hypothetical protein